MVDAMANGLLPSVPQTQTGEVLTMEAAIEQKRTRKPKRTRGPVQVSLVWKDWLERKSARHFLETGEKKDPGDWIEAALAKAHGFPPPPVSPPPEDRKKK